MTHVPLYCSNSGHWMEGELLRQSMEPLLYQYGVDLIIAGHVHAYERTYPIYNNTLDPCGPVHILLGDGGNYEGAYVPWRDPQPSWSAFRESSFGAGQINVISAQLMQFQWHRHACGSSSSAALKMNFSDSCVTPGDNSAQKMFTTDICDFAKPSKSTCPNKYISSSSSGIMQRNLKENRYSGATSATSFSKKYDSKDGTVIVLISLCLILTVLLWRSKRRFKSVLRNNSVNIPTEQIV